MADKADSKKHDLILVHGRTDDGEGVRALRSRPGRLESTEIRPLREGQPIGEGEVVALKPRKEHPLLMEVEVLHDGGTTSASRAGPPQVASARYRRNWELVFGPSDEAEGEPNDGSMLN